MSEVESASDLFDHLSTLDLARIHRSLMRRYRNLDGSNIAAISFGAKRVRGRVSRRDGPTVRFLVRSKRPPRSQDKRVPDNVVVRLRSNSLGRPVRLVLATDVEELDSIVPTGVLAAGPSDSATAGIVFRIRLPDGIGSDPSAFFWRALSVGHFLIGDRVPISVRLAGRGQGKRSTSTVVRVRAARRERFDVAAFDAEYASLQRSMLLRSATTSLTVRSERSIQADAVAHSVGKLFRRPDQGGVITFTVLDYLPEMTLGSLGTIQSVIRATARGPGAFRPGTSGAVWQIGGELAGLQLAAEDGGRVGYAQALASTLEDWVRVRCDGVPEIQAAF